MHAGGHVREAFWKVIEMMGDGEVKSAPEGFRQGLARWIQEDESKETVGSLVGKLLHCTDTLPQTGSDVRDLGFEFGKNTYAAATRAILRG